MTNYYYCYNPTKKNFILEHGLNYIDKDIHIKTNKTFWIFVKGDKLNDILKDWRVYQKKRFND